MSQRPLDEYLTMPYSKVLVADETGGYVAEVLEFPGCLAEGETPEEAISNLNDSMEAWIEAVLESGGVVPEPLELQSFSGRFVLRMPKWVHKDATRRAQIEGASLNQWIVDAIGERLGMDRTLARVHDVLADYRQQQMVVLEGFAAPPLSWSVPVVEKWTTLPTLEVGARIVGSTKWYVPVAPTMEGS